MPKGQFSQEHKDYLRNKMKKIRIESKDKNYDEIYGVEKAKEIKNKIGLKSRGHKMTEENKIILLNLSKGKKLSLETKNKISHSRIESGVASGKNNPMYNKHRFAEQNPNWRNGSSFEEYPQEFNKQLKQEIRKRDGYTCQICLLKKDNCNFPVHHIDYNKKNNTPVNLITLCNRCHSTTNAHRKIWKIWFYSLMLDKFKTKYFDKVSFEVPIQNDKTNITYERRS